VHITRENAAKEVGAGWSSLVARCIAALDEIGEPYEIHQVKEKFGGLRFYFAFDEALSNPDNDHGIEIRIHLRRAAYENISAIEAESFRTCEKCGALGQRASNGHWIKTLCGDHLVVPLWSGGTSQYVFMPERE
jgi:hypothetical protein